MQKDCHTITKQSKTLWAAMTRIPKRMNHLSGILFPIAALMLSGDEQISSTIYKPGQWIRNWTMCFSDIVIVKHHAHNYSRYDAKNWANPASVQEISCVKLDDNVFIVLLLG